MITAGIFAASALAGVVLGFTVGCVHDCFVYEQAIKEDIYEIINNLTKESQDE